MFIRQYKTKNKKTGKVYIKHQLVLSYRTEAGPRQRIIMNLGKVQLEKSQWRRLAFALEGRLSGQQALMEEPDISAATAQIMKNYEFYKIQKKRKESKGKFLSIALESVGTTACRSLGPELVAQDTWKNLSMDHILRTAGLKRQNIELAKAVITARLLSPGSEAHTQRWIRYRSSIAELINTDLLNTKKDSVYDISDILLYYKDEIEKLLREKEATLFPRDSTLFLYDLTNTYFEGACKGNSIAKRGDSKEKRIDCKLVTLALLVDSQGFPVFSQIYEGGKSEPITLLDVLDRLEKDVDKTLLTISPTLVMDKGIATKDNIALLKKRGYDYLVVERRKVQEDYLEEFAKAKDTFEKIIKKDNTIYFKKIKTEDGARLLTLSETKKEKEESMDTLKENRFLEDLTNLKKSIKKGNVRLKEKVGRRIGRIMERYPTVAKYYDITLVLDKSQKEAVTIKTTKKKTRDDRKILTGCYVIETTHKDMDAEEILKSYTMLTRVEKAFQSLKTDLGIRPIYHQKAERTRGHLFISVLAYHLLNSIEVNLKDKGCTKKWSTIRRQLSTHMRTTVIMTDRKGGIHHIRVSSTPESSHQEIYNLLDIKDPLKRIHLKL